jgi:HD-GYP domain-containing protein (c-di-GMP phosphodiesterase class II)/CHASE1-domain containing sensor protein
LYHPILIYCGKRDSPIFVDTKIGTVPKYIGKPRHKWRPAKVLYGLSENSLQIIQSDLYFCSMIAQEPSQVAIQPVPRKNYLPAYLAICLGLVLSTAVFFLTRYWELRTIKEEFTFAAADRSTAVKRVFDTRLTTLELIRSTLARAIAADPRRNREIRGGAAPLDQSEYHELLLPFFSHAEGIQDVEWVPRVPDAERAEYEDAIRRNGMEDFHITEQDKQGRPAPAARRDEYFPITFVEPNACRAAVLGFDVGSEPTRFETLRLARDSGQTVASGRISFVEAPNQYGFFVALPVYRANAPTYSLEQRRENLVGFVLGVFRPGNVLEWALGKLQPQGIDVCLRDASSPAGEGIAFFHASRTREVPGKTEDQRVLRRPTNWKYAADLNLDGYRWTLECTPTPGFIASRKTWWPLIVLGSGLIFTGMLAAYLRVSVDRSASIRCLAEARARQIEEHEALIFAKREYTERLEGKVREQTLVIRRAQEETIHRLISASLWRDEETGMHIRRTGLFSEALAKAAGWPAAAADRIRTAAPMHDVGKIGTPDAVLRKPGKLTPEEFEIMKLHTIIGARILGGSDEPMLRMAKEIALNHHERWDGNGYPNGLAGEAIPESARIVAIVDVYDAITHDRVYRPALPDDQVLSIMREGAGTHFDPFLLTMFLSILDEIDRIAREHRDEPSKEYDFQQPELVY